jgi:outer membrane protein TolC
VSTVRTLIAECQKEMLGDMSPARAAFQLSRMTSLLGNCSTEIREAEADYNGVYAQALRVEQKANRAKIFAQTTPQYWRLREAKDQFELVAEIVRSLKVILRTAEAEMRLAR